MSREREVHLQAVPALGAACSSDAGEFDASALQNQAWEGFSALKRKEHCLRLSGAVALRASTPAEQQPVELLRRAEAAEMNGVNVGGIDKAIALQIDVDVRRSFGPGATPVAPATPSSKASGESNRRSAHSSASCHAASTGVLTAAAGVKDKATLPLTASPVPRGHTLCSALRTSRERALRRVLRAYAMRRPAVGYCQGLNLLGARLLMTADGDVDAAFWLLVALCEGPLRGYHEQDMAACSIEAAVLEELVRQRLPRLARHLQALDLPVPLLAMRWFVCAFCSRMASCTAQRVLDVVLAHTGTGGNGDQRARAVMLAIALALLRSQEDRLLACDEIPEVTATLASAEEKLLDADTLLHAAQHELRLEGGAVALSLLDGAELQKRRDAHRAATLALCTQGNRHDKGCGGVQQRYGLVDAAATAAVDVTCRVLKWFRHPKTGSKSSKAYNHKTRKRPRQVVLGTRIVDQSESANGISSGTKTMSLSPPKRKRLLALR